MVLDFVLETPILARWLGGVTFLKADFESVILNFELELLNQHFEREYINQNTIIEL